MKRSILLIIVSVIALLPTNSISSFAIEEKETIIVGYTDTIDLASIENYELHHVYETINAVSVTVPTSEIIKLIRNPKIKWIEKDQEVATSSQIVSWGYEAIFPEEAKEIEFTGKGIKIGVIDTGISVNHPDLEVTGGTSVVNGIVSYDDDHGHGTHVAGIIAAKDNDIGTVGVAPEASLYAIKALDQSGEGKMADIIEGIEWAIEQDLDILNLSFTSETGSIALKQVVKEASEQGIVMVASSGNKEEGEINDFDDVLYPAKYPEVIAIGSINETFEMSPFTIGGPSLDFSAPGQYIYSTYKQHHKNGYAHMSGTSMAAPYVTGMIALMLEEQPELASSEIREILEINVMDLGEEGKDNQFGHGLVQYPILIEEKDPTPSLLSFSDLKEGEWYSEHVNYLIGRNYIQGYPDGTFRPQGNITRGEVVTLLGRVMELNGELRETTFTDVDSAYFGSGYIAEATEREIITGYPNGTFKPDEFITRGDIALIIQRAFTPPKTDKQFFKDVSGNQYYSKAVNDLYGLGIINGYPDGTFKPEEPISRAEFSTIISKTMNKLLKNE